VRGICCYHNGLFALLDGIGDRGLVLDVGSLAVLGQAGADADDHKQGYERGETASVSTATSGSTLVAITSVACR
jgi:hypothetical protein